MQIIKFLCKTSSKTLLNFMEIIEYLVKLVKIKVIFLLCTIVRFQFEITGISHIFFTFLISPTFPIVLALHVLISVQC